MFIQILIGLGFVVAIYIVATLEARERERFKFKQYLTNFHYPMGTTNLHWEKQSPLFFLMEITYYENFNNFKRSF